MTGNIQTTKPGLPGQVLKLDEQGKPFWSGSSYPIVSNQMVSLTSCTAGITGNVTSDGGSPVTSRGVVWSTSPNPTILSSIVIEGNGIGSFSTTLPNLAPNTTYFIRAFATNEVGTGYGSEIKITTFSGTAKPTVTTNPISDVTSTTAISGGIVTGDCGSVVTARGVVWSTSPNPTISLNTKTINGTGIGSFASNLTSLTPNTTYYVKAYATNNGGTGYGDEVTFKTSQNCGFKPVLSGTFALCKGNSTTLATNISGGIWSSNDPSIAAINSTTGNVKGLNKGCAKIDYLLKGTNGCPDVNSSIFVTIDSIEEPNITEVNLPICVGKEAVIRGEFIDFSIINPSLVDIDTTYYIIDPSPDDSCPIPRTIYNLIFTGKKFGTTTITMSYGGKNSCPIKSITKEITVLSCSKPTVTTLSISSLTATTASIGGNVTSDGGAPITSRGVVWSTSPNPTISSNTKTTNGSGTGSFNSSLTGLIPNTTYYIRAYAINDVGPGYGNEITFKTSQNCSPNPVLSGSDILCIGSSTAISSNILGGIWSSSNPNVATVFQSLGIVNAISEGFTEITYLIKGINGCPDVSSKFPISIISKETKLDITGDNFVCEGNTTFLYSTIYPGYLEWSIQDTFIAIDGCVFQGGPSGPTPIANQICIKGKKSGLTTITFKYGGSGGCPELSVTRQINVLTCSGDNPLVFTDRVTNINNTTAVGNGKIISRGISSIIDSGIVWSINPKPEIALTSKHSMRSNEKNIIVGNLTNLIPNTKYFVRAYVRNSAGFVAYGEDITFITSNNVLGKACPGITTVRDIDGNTYNTVQIGSQCWIKENLRVTKYNDGSVIPLDQTGGPNGNGSGQTWSQFRNGARTVLGNSFSNLINFGYLYNWYAGMDLKGICPVGWKIPSTEDWEQLCTYLGDIELFKKLSAIGAWGSNNNGVTNESGFTALPSGFRNANMFSSSSFNGKFEYNSAAFINSIQQSEFSLSPTNISLYSPDGGLDPVFGFSIRCLKYGPSYDPIPSISIENVKVFGSSSLEISVKVHSDGGSPVTSRGIVWSLEPNPSIELTSKTMDGIGIGSFTSKIIGLQPSTKYYIRAYATNSKGTSYGIEEIGTTSAILQGNSCPNLPTIKDIDNNSYNTVQIGSQCWMRENLRVTRYSDGSLIPLDVSGGNTGVGNGETWSKLTTGARTIYGNDINNLTTFGYLYNWYAGTDSRGLCPNGWRVPTSEDWGKLDKSLTSPNYMDVQEGGKMKTLTSQYWLYTNYGATNESGFSALPGGLRFENGAFNFLKMEGRFLSSGVGDINGRKITSHFILRHNSDRLSLGTWFYQDNLKSGVSVRCVKN